MLIKPEMTLTDLTDRKVEPCCPRLNYYHQKKCMMVRMRQTLVTGAGGFIGGWLTKRLQKEGNSVFAVDKKPFSEWYQLHDSVTNLTTDLTDFRAVEEIFANTDIDAVYNLAADMGGMGFIENNKALCMASAPIHLNLLRSVAERNISVNEFFFSSSACVYRQELQTYPDVVALKEEDAYPADPEDGYGWEKLFNERASRHYFEDFRIPVSIARYHNVYGSHGTWRGGREKAPAAIARKIALAKILGGNHRRIEIWGDGTQTRSFTFINDAIEGTVRLARSGFRAPLNIGSSELVSINALVDLIQEIADIEVATTHLLDAPLGVAGRNSDNTLCRRVLSGWEPSTPLRQGMTELYKWVEAQIIKELEAGTPVKDIEK